MTIDTSRKHTELDNSSDYLQGARACYNNAMYLIESANILFDNNKNSFAFFSLYTALEELVKGQICLLINKGALSRNWNKNLFANHPIKIILSERLLQMLSINNGEALLEGRHIDSKFLNELKDRYEKETMKATNIRESYLYVEPGTKGWHFPNNIDEIDEQRNAMLTELKKAQDIFQALEVIEFTRNFLNNIRVYSTSDNELTVAYDEV